MNRASRLKHGYSLAEAAEALGDSKVVTAEHYVYALGDYREAARGKPSHESVTDAREVRTQVRTSRAQKCRFAGRFEAFTAHHLEELELVGDFLRSPALRDYGP